jgi:hypothetical protein
VVLDASPSPREARVFVASGDARVHGLPSTLQHEVIEARRWLLHAQWARVLAALAMFAHLSLLAIVFLPKLCGAQLLNKQALFV